MKPFVSVSLVCALSFVTVPTMAFAQAIAVPPRVGDRQEGFEDLPRGPLDDGMFAFIFGRDATLRGMPFGGGIFVSGGWIFRCLVEPHEGRQFVGSTIGSNVIITFEDQPATFFGGYFVSNGDASGTNGTAMFFREDQTLIDEQPLNLAPDCEWTWNGWAFVEPVSLVVFTSGTPDGDFLQVDNLQLTQGQSCRADIDDDGELTIFDFLGFQNLFALGDLDADFDGDGVLTLFDFLEFQNDFDAGCP
ncbi:MAG: GC-type dockerin domain-anchored protein [Phycisphaerales bacterium]